MKIGLNSTNGCASVTSVMQCLRSRRDRPFLSTSSTHPPVGGSYGSHQSGPIQNQSSWTFRTCWCPQWIPRELRTCCSTCTSNERRCLWWEEREQRKPQLL